MRLKLLLVLLFLLSIQMFAQVNEWSVEANYALIPSEGFGGNDNIIDVGLKYRLKGFKFFNLGLGSTVGFSNDKSTSFVQVGKVKSYYFQPRIFSEFTPSGFEKLRPAIGLGYSIVNNNVSGMSNDINLSSNTTIGGFNFNLGISYDIIKRLFIQVLYDFIKLQNQENSNNIRFGVGFRF